MSIVGLGPHGERAAPPERVVLLPEDIAEVRRKDLRVAMVMHTLESDWAKQLVRGAIGKLGECGVTVIDVLDCGFSPDLQVEALTRLSSQNLDAVISLPVGNTAVVDAHRSIAACGARLMLIDNAPTSLLPGKDYACLVSADNFGLGRIAAELLSEHVAEGGPVGLIGFDSDFFATNEREIAFIRWMETHRPDIAIKTARFATFADVAAQVEALLADEQRIVGMFVVWDTPCIEALRVLERNKSRIPVTTVDLGKDVSTSLAEGGPIVGIAAQRPFQQGESVALATITDLLGRKCPDWLALPGLAVSRKNVVQSYQAIWGTPAPREILIGKDVLSS